MTQIQVKPPSQWTVEPPLIPLETASTLIGCPPWNYRVTDPPENPREALATMFCKPLPSWLTDDDRGGVRDLVVAHQNIALASVVLEKMLFDYLQVCAVRDHGPSLRLIVSIRLVSYGAHQLSAAHVMHLREEAFHQVSALSLARTAIELIARGGWVALGNRNEPDQVVYGPRLPSHNDRRRYEVNTTNCMKVIEAKARRAWPGADSPVDVYRYLCQFTHFDGRVVELLGSEDARKLREWAYAATAYVAWLAAAMAGVIVGQETVARQPRLPATPPWRTP